MNKIWSLNIPGQTGPVVAVALHNGHLIRDELIPLLAVDEHTRRREEDPHTGAWTAIGDIQIIGTHSRFEVDLNRNRDRAVYMEPEDAWGIKIFKNEISHEVYNNSLAQYDDFYAFMHDLLTDLEQRFGRFVVYDLHSYNHRRGGIDAPYDSPLNNPEVNIGTGTMNRARWAPLIDGLTAALIGFDYNGRALDVRENIKFKGGGFSRFVHEHFPLSGCAIAIEFKKFWMNEWSGEVNTPQHRLILKALKATVPIVRKALKECG